MKLLKLFFVFAAIFLVQPFLKAQPDYTNETKLNQSSFRQVSGDENKYSSFCSPSNIPQNLIDAYSIAGERNDEAEKLRLSKEIDKYLNTADSKLLDPSEYSVSYEENPGTDWYSSDVLVHTGDIDGYSYRTMDLQQAEDGRMYLAVARRNVSGYNSSIRIYESINGGATWPTFIVWNYTSLYIQSISMLVERRDNIDDSTRIFVYFIASTSSNFDNAVLYMFSSRRNATGVYTMQIASPSVGNRFTYVSACSDGLFTSSATAEHIIVREETNAGVYAANRHFRSIDWGLTHTVSTFNTFYDDRYPSAAFSNESGNDTIYIAVERHISANEWEIRLITTPEIPGSNYQVRYITDATPGIMYERPAITIQQRYFMLPQQILVTSTKNDRAVYHASTDGGASWNVDAALGLANQSVDFTSCNSDSLTAGGGYFIAAYVDLGGDSVTVRRGILGAMGNVQHKRNSNPSTSSLAPICAIYKVGTEKYSALSYAGFGPENVYYNMENLVTGISQISGNIPSAYNLSQNYPNPFNPATNIEFAIPKSSFIKLVIYDITGREVETLVNQNLAAGKYKTDWNAVNYSSGVYFYKLITDGFNETKKMMLIK